MTRINLVDPKLLTKQHLIAERRELPRIFTRVKKPVDLRKTPTSYRMGTGHVTFFYDKIKFLRNRYVELCDECLRRGVNIDTELSVKILSDSYDIPPELNFDWVPCDKDIQVNLQRLIEKDNTHYKRI